MDVVRIRPPLVYGPGVKANFRTMMDWVHKGTPLPFGSVTQNRRTLIGVDNLNDLIRTCIDHPGAANRLFLAGDGEDLSTADLLHRLAQAMGKPSRLIRVPTRLLEALLGMVGMSSTARRLLRSLQVDTSKARLLLNWTPPISVDEGFRRAAVDRYAPDYSADGTSAKNTR
jgi:nucleoside-diphosphate-sugar epimerase